jgi:hypothetical protein
MARKIIIKHGALNGRGKMPLLDSMELGYQVDEDALYIGRNAQNHRLCGKNDVNNINTQIEELRGLISDLTARLDELNK